jgi:hypothetical protein
MKTILLAAIIALAPSLALAQDSSLPCDRTDVPTAKCPYPGNPFYRPPGGTVSNGFATGAAPRDVVVSEPRRARRRSQ